MSIARYVYLISDHEEDGAENLVATTDRSRLSDLIGRHLTACAERAGSRSRPPDPSYVEECATRLAELAGLDDETLARAVTHPLAAGWGSMQLHVVRLL